MIVEFEYALHDNQDTEGRCEQIMQTADEHIEIGDDLAEKIGRPFYEVTLSCTLDTETGAVEILSARRT
jgi:hypothetical protein